MNMKALAVYFLLLMPVVVAAEDEPHQSMRHGSHASDDRISLGLSPPMKQHQLENMRAHLSAVKDIIALLSQENFTQASLIAHKKLGLTEAMESMCNRFENDTFKELGIQFHKSADELGETLAKGDMQGSLAALSNTMSYCVSCHAQFKQ
ncbi:MAG TPA: cytochrome C [Halieaceae bacterium]|nr:cytochrome C [Halieaceae bacterium]